MTDQVTRHSRLKGVLGRISYEIAEVGSDVSEVESVLFSWLGEVRTDIQRPVALQKLDLAIQSLSEIATFLDCLCNEIGNDHDFCPEDAISKIRLASLRDSFSEIAISGAASGQQEIEFF